MVRVGFAAKPLFACQHTLYLSQPGCICPIWHGTLCSVMSEKVKITTDMTGYAPAGKIESFSSPRK